MTTVCDFTSQEVFNRSELLSEAIEVLMYEKTDLGHPYKVMHESEGKKEAISLLRRLSEEQAVFSPKLDVRRLCAEDFMNCKLEPSVDVLDKLKKIQLLQGHYTDNAFSQIRMGVYAC
jgi:hypothetical protein